MPFSPSAQPPLALAIFSVETILRDPLPLPEPLQAKLSVPPRQFAEALLALTPELRATLLRCIEEHAGKAGLSGPLTLAELRAFLLGGDGASLKSR